MEGKKSPEVDRSKKGHYRLFRPAKAAGPPSRCRTNTCPCRITPGKPGTKSEIYFKEPGKALRFMNITKTDIFKK